MLVPWPATLTVCHRDTEPPQTGQTLQFALAPGRGPRGRGMSSSPPPGSVTVPCWGPGLSYWLECVAIWLVTVQKSVQEPPPGTAATSCGGPGPQCAHAGLGSASAAGSEPDANSWERW